MISTAGASADRAVGSLVGAAIGDALGWPQEPRGGLVGGARARANRPPKPEFTGWDRNAGSRFLRYQERVQPGEYSDDTQLMLAVARSCLKGDLWLRHLTKRELPAWPTYQRGGGRAVLSAANAWGSGVPPWEARPGQRLQAVDAYFAAGANGAAMRIAPHAVWLAQRSEGSALRRRVMRDAVTTHGHPRAIIGAMCLATTISVALAAREPLVQDELIAAAASGLSPLNAVADDLPSGWADSTRQAWFEATWEDTLREMRDLLEVARRSVARGSMSNVSDTLRELGATGEFSGSGTHSVVAAIYLASRAGARPMGGLLQAAFEPDIDTDTVASMTASVLGAVHGVRWLEPMLDVQDLSYIADMANRLAAPSDSSDQVEQLDEEPVSARLFQRQLDGGADSGPFVDGRRFRVLERSLLNESPWVVRYRLELSDGQKVIVDRAKRTPPEREGELSSPKHVDVAVASAVLPTRDLAATRAFYERVLGRRLVVQQGTLELGAGIGFVEVSDSTQSWTPDAQVTVRVEAITAAMQQVPAARMRVDGTAILKDPDGRLVVLIEKQGNRNA